MTESQPNYHSFLLRLWFEPEANQQPWRIILVDPHTDERWGFTKIDQLTQFLQEQTKALSPTNHKQE
jgi:hypothetical protein